MSSICTSNVTSGFIDLATFDEVEKYMYGGPEATAYFVRCTAKSTWFTQVPVVLSRASGQPDFNQEWSVSISRAGDYLIHSWLRLCLPEVALLNPAQANAGKGLCWTRNFMHNLIRECCITFNDLVAARFDNFHLDFWAAFTVPAGKQTGYNNMIGNFDAMVQPQKLLEAQTLNLPLPFFYSRDHCGAGVALPTAALPYNEMRINFAFRSWQDLLILADGAAAASQRLGRPEVGQHIAAAPVLVSSQVWANYAIVSNDERKRMACAPRDILIEQVQTAPKQTFGVASNNFDIRFSHAVKVIFFGARNKTHTNVWSNYQTHSPSVSAADPPLLDFTPPFSADPITATSLIYENTARLSSMGSDYYSLMNPYYHSPVIPEETGFHMYSYSLDFYCLDPMGSTNFGKLTNVSLVPEASSAAATAAAGQGAARGVNGSKGGADYNQCHEFCVTVVNNNIIRVSGGALGFPVL